MSRLVHTQLNGIKIVGFSLAGEETVIAAPEYDVAFDVGRAPREIIPIENVCVSHGHMDHAAGVAYYLSQRSFLGAPPGRVIVHRDLAQSFQKLMDIWGDIEGHPSPGQILGVDHLEDVRIRRGLLLRAFCVNHGASALGFSLIEVRNKLKAEHHGKSSAQLVELKRQGVAIEDAVEVTLLTYTGDTALGRFLDLDFVQSSRALIVECTFYEAEHRSRAGAGRHIHVDDLPRVLEAAPHAKVLLTHVTRRTDLRLAKRIAERTIRPEDRQRVSFLMDRPARRHFSPSRREPAGTNPTETKPTNRV